MKYSYRMKVFVSLLLFTTAIVVTLSLIDYNKLKSNIIKEEEKNRQQTQLYALDAVKTIDMAYKVFDSQLDVEMKATSDKMVSYYNEHPNVNEWDYQSLRKTLGFDIYVIDREYVITDSSLASDVGLDFKVVSPDFTKILAERFKKGGFASEGMGIEDLTGKAKKYTYITTPDNQYIIELGYDVQASILFDTFNYPSIKKQLKEKSPSIEDVRFLLNRRVLGESDKNGKAIILDKKYQKAYNETFKHHTNTEYVEKKGDISIVHRFVYYSYTKKEQAAGLGKVVEVTFNDKNLQSILKTERQHFVIKLAITLLATMLISYFISEMINRAVRKMTKLIEKTTSFDLTEDQSVINGNDELGKMEKMIHTMRKELKDIAVDIHHTSDLLIDNAQKVSALTREVNDESIQTASGAYQLSIITEEVTEAVQNINSTVQRINAMVLETSDKISHARDTSQKSSERANEWKQNSIQSKEQALVVYENVKQEIEEALLKVKSVERINEMAQSIGDIANQTNLLSLNASIEAARAGESGRSFMVVAEEVKKLATNTSTTAKDIQDVTTSIQNNVQDVADSVNGILSFIEERVLRDYDSVIDDAEEYKKDIQIFTDLLRDFSTTFHQLNDDMNNTTQTLSHISDSFKENSENVRDIAERTENVANKNQEVNEKMNANIEVSDALRQLIDRFKF